MNWELQITSTFDDRTGLINVQQIPQIQTVQLLVVTVEFQGI